MPGEARTEMPREVVPLFFIVDTSGSMAGTYIGAVNSAIEETLEELREMNDESNDAEVEVAVLEFSDGAKWITQNGPVKVENYYWNPLNASGLTAMGEAFRMLEEKLHSTSGFLSSATSILVRSASRTAGGWGFPASWCAVRVRRGICGRHSPMIATRRWTSTSRLAATAITTTARSFAWRRCGSPSGS